MSETPEHLVKRLREEGEKTLAFLQGLPHQVWDRQVYTEGACWTVRQVLAHFVSAELSLIRLVMNILKGGAGTPQDFDVDAYNERHVAEFQTTSPSELMKRFAALRQETINLVQSMQPTDLARVGRHPYLGMATLEDIVKLIYRHNGIHIREIRAKLTNL